jgi:hypothetical protein
VFGVKPDIVELKTPVPEPSFVLVLKEIVGLEVDDQTTPLEVTAAPPSELIFPTDVAVVVVIELKYIALTLGRTNDVLVVKMT